MINNELHSVSKKQALIEAAFKLFYEKGYEKTSIRDILNEVGGEVGMFYHYFKSKEEIFDLAVAHFISVKELAFSNAFSEQALSINEKLDALIAFQFDSIKQYQTDWSDKIHWSMASAIHKRTLDHLSGVVENLLKEAVANEEIVTPDIGVHELARFLVFGASGILHEKSFNHLSTPEVEEKRQCIIRMIDHALKI